MQLVQVASRALENALARLKEAQVLQFTGVTRKEELRSRRDVVQRYAAANDRVRAVATNSSTFFRTELQRLGASPESIEKSTREMEQATREQNRLVLAIRNSDTRMMTGMTGVLDLLENNWGKWKSDSELVTFEDTALARKYNALIQEIQAAGEAQISAQRKLVNLR